MEQKLIAHIIMLCCLALALLNLMNCIYNTVESPVRDVILCFLIAGALALSMLVMSSEKASSMLLGM